MYPRFRDPIAVVVLAAVVLAPGCDAGSHPVTGKVTLDGSPLPDKPAALSGIVHSRCVASTHPAHSILVPSSDNRVRRSRHVTRRPAAGRFCPAGRTGVPFVQPLAA
jgi:hypothetical protein